jgi:hypothetical protein
LGLELESSFGTIIVVTGSLSKTLTEEFENVELFSGKKVEGEGEGEA